MGGPDRRQQVEALFVELLGRSSRERAIRLDEACAGDVELRADIESLLRHHEDSRGVLDDAPGFAMLGLPSPAQRVPADGDRDLVGKRVGEYRVVSFLGEGGMGVVYLAEQREPVRRRVALKVVRAGFSSPDVIRRFESERQALALMDHPNIAHIFDAATTEGGRPYFTMEHVTGLPLTQYCDQHRLTIRERLQLFLKVCDGVQHAHQKGIIHRDLKPSNVLVTIQNDVAQPKIIDFGVAKALHHRLHDKTLVTQLGVMIGTPDYMSPEQAGSSGVDVDTRSDVYSLGVILYELLSGRLPFDSREKSDDLAELHRRLTSLDPPTPSGRLGSLGGPASAIAEKRQTTCNGLVRTLRRDLDWISMKALEKERMRRYESAAGLAADVRRYLEDEPVLAGPPTWRYRLGKTIHKHRAAAAATAAVAAMLVVATATSTWFAVNADRARQEAERQSNYARAYNDFFREVVFSAGVLHTSGQEVTLRQALDRAAGVVDSMLVDDPEARRYVHHRIGATYLELSAFDQAEKHLLRALALSEELAEPDLTVVIAANDGLAEIRMNDGATAEAVTHLEIATEAARTLHGEGHLYHADLLLRLAQALDYATRREESAEIYAQFLDVEADSTSILTCEYAAAHSGYGRLLSTMGRYDEAHEHLVQALDITTRRGDADSLHFWWDLFSIGKNHMRKGANETALSYTEQAKSFSARLAPSHRWHINTELQLGLLQARTGRFEQATKTLEDVVDVIEANIGRKDPYFVLGHTYLGELRHREGGLAGARAEYEAAYAVCLEIWTERKDYREAQLVHNWGKLELELGNAAAAAARFGQAYSMFRTRYGAGHPRAMKSGRGLARALSGGAKYDQAREVLQELRRDSAERNGADHPLTSEIDELASELRRGNAGSRP